MHLDERDRIKIATLYKEGGITYQQLADRFGVSKQTIYRICRNLNKKVDTSLESPPNLPNPNPTNVQLGNVIQDPIEFRRSKIEEIQNDIITMRLKGSAHALPALHRLHVNLHDEWMTMREEIEEDQTQDPEEILYTIAHAVKNLPPILKDRLAEMLEDNVVSIERDIK